MKKFTHLVSLNIPITSDNEEPSKEEILKAFQNAVRDLNLENISDKTEWYETE